MTKRSDTRSRKKRPNPSKAAPPRRARRQQREQAEFELPTRTAIHPCQPLRLETSPEELCGRIIDLTAPLGKGSRALIVAPPRAGKTVLLQKISKAMTYNYPEVKQHLLLVDERPEEATEMREILQATVHASTFDQLPEDHTQLARQTLRLCMAEAYKGADVVLMVDSLTRLARAENKTAKSGGATGSGGLDIRACDFPRRLFGAARAFAEGGSLTIVATALVETGSQMDAVIFEEFKGTGNVEMVLDRKIAEARVYPALHVKQSGTREEQRLREPRDQPAIDALMRTLSQLSPLEAITRLSQRLAKFENNANFLRMVSNHANV